MGKKVFCFAKLNKNIEILAKNLLIKAFNCDLFKLKKNYKKGCQIYIIYKKYRFLMIKPLVFWLNLEIIFNVENL